LRSRALNPEMQIRERCRYGAPWGLCAVGVVLFSMLGGQARAAVDAKAVSARLSDNAFALLDAVTKSHDSNALLGPVGVFAADAQKRSAAIQSGDHRGAGAAMAALKSDAATVGKAAASGGLDKAKWSAIEHDLDALAAVVPAVAAAPDSTPPEAASAAPASHSESETGASPGDLAVTIDSTQMVASDVLRVKGSMRGRGIRSAGIYLGATRLGRLNLKPESGPRVINFSLDIHSPTPGSVLRVYDIAGRSAEAAIEGAAQTVPNASVEGPPPAVPSLDSPDELASKGDDLSSESSGLSADTSTKENTEEIPAATPPPSEPKLRMPSHLTDNGPNDVRIQIDSVSQVDAGMRSYLVRGQIVGRNLKKAGIYIDGRLVQKIPLNRGVGLRTSNFAQSFSAVGSEATIRVYRAKDDYTESSIELGSGPAIGSVNTTGPVALGSPLTGSPLIGSLGGGGLNPGPIAVQITSVQAAAPNLYVVSGYVSGRHIASAGLYQNGMLIQSFNVSSGSGGGIGGLISGLISGQQISFAGRFNPAAGFTSVRAYDRSGNVTEQPVMGGGTMYGTNPYGVNPYARSPYMGLSPGVGMAPGIGVAPYNSTLGVGVAPSRGMPW
jgi:hypothetical protein